jgi:hypothetical protein
VALAAAGLLAGAVIAAPPAAAAVGVPRTYDGMSYSSTVNKPSEDKPQSKLWYTDGSWWALMVSPSDDRVHIFQLRADHTWRDTGVKVDNRLNSTGDALWSASDQTLVVVSRDDTANPRIARFSYNAGSGTYSMDPGFPVNVVTGGGSESATIDRDSTGRLWITYTRQSRIWVAHSDPSGLNWTAGYNPDVPDVVLKGDDISSIIAFNGRIGVMWSDQQSGAFRFAIHKDGDPDDVWTVEDALSGATVADDHINLKQVTNDADGRIFAAIKTSNDNQGPDATLVGVLVRQPKADGSGTWSLVPSGTVADDHTRPLVMIDQTNEELYFLATAPVQGGDIFYKKTSLANPSFGPGRGEPFVDSSFLVNNASGSKDPVTAQSGLVILAVGEGRKRYVHAEMELAGGGGSGPPPADTQAPSTPSGVTATPSAGKVDLSWQPSSDDTGISNYVVRRDGTVVGSPSDPGFTDTAVTPGATYSYRVQAVDVAGNTSGQSTAVSATVPDEPAPPGSGDITLRGTSTAANDAEGTITVPVPAHDAGSLLLATVDFRGKPSISAPPGWTLVRWDVNGSALQKATYWKYAGSSEPASYTWDFSARPPAVASMLAFSGVAGSDPIQASGGSVNDRSDTVTAPSVTTTAEGALLVGLFGVPRESSIGNPPGMTELTEVSSPASVRYPATAETASEPAGSPGPTGQRVATTSTAAPGIGQLIALRRG